ncbi:MAG: hypothetical protein ACOC2Y_06945 [Spirochaetota bacterium]
MRLLKLALRAVVEWRASSVPAVAAVALVAAVATLAGSVYVPIAAEIEEAVRVAYGEASGSLDASTAREIAASAESQDVLVSASITRPGALDSVADLLLVRVVRTDLRRELRFRGREDRALEGADFAPGDAVLFTAGQIAATREGRVSRVFTPDGDGLVRIVRTAPASHRGTELVINEPYAEPTTDSAIEVLVRGRNDTIRDLRPFVRSGLSETGWKTTAARINRGVSSSLQVLLGALLALAVGTLVPGQLLLARRARPFMQLLSAWGFTRRAIRWFTVGMGAFSAAAAAVVGGGLGLVAAGVMNARPVPAAELLPLRLAEQVSAYSVGAVTPAMGWAAATVATATLLGALTALPSALIAGRLSVRRGLWHW